MIGPGVGPDKNSKTTSTDQKYTPSLGKMAPETTSGRLIFILNGERFFWPNFAEE